MALLIALWAGLIRVGWILPVIQPTLILAHGPLMVSGFLGTLISLERVVALKKTWMYPGPALSGIGSLVLAVRAPSIPGEVLITISSLVLVAIFIVIIRQHRALYTVTMTSGALAWTAGNLLWLFGLPVYHIVLWWAGFFILTIIGERLELGRIIRLSHESQVFFTAAAALFSAGLIITIPLLDFGTRLAGIGMAGLSLWLFRYDIARRTIRQKGLPRYAAICLLAGYGWLGFAGLPGILNGGVTSGFLYDALLHSIFLGFVISMIFGHAPIIFPSILHRSITYSPVLYIHLVLLHASLLLRVAGDLLSLQEARLWGGLFNVIAMLIFVSLIVAQLSGFHQKFSALIARQ